MLSEKIVRAIYGWINSWHGVEFSNSLLSGGDDGLLYPQNWIDVKTQQWINLACLSSGVPANLLWVEVFPGKFSKNMQKYGAVKQQKMAVNSRNLSEFRPQIWRCPTKYRATPRISSIDGIGHKPILIGFPLTSPIHPIGPTIWETPKRPAVA